MNIQYSKPMLAEVPLAIGLTWRGGGEFLFQEKSDGVWEQAVVQCPMSPAFGGIQFRVNAERMRDGAIVVNDMIAVQCPMSNVQSWEDCRHWPTRRRWQTLCEMWRVASDAGAEITSPVTPHSSPVRLARTGSGGEFLEAELARGGEGIVAKAWEAPFGVNWIKCKRVATWDLVVLEKDEARGTLLVQSPKSNVQCREIAPTWIPCKREFDRIQVGEVIEVAAHSVHRSGKLREARFVRRRTDKQI